MRTILIHLNVTVPDGDEREADEIAKAVMAAIEVGSDDESVSELEVTCTLAEEV